MMRGIREEEQTGKWSTRAAYSTSANGREL